MSELAVKTLTAHLLMSLLVLEWTTEENSSRKPNQLTEELALMVLLAQS